MPNEPPYDWSAYRRRRRAGWLMLLSLFPSVALTFAFAAAIPSPFALLPLIALQVAFAWWGWRWLWSVRCPRCGEAFFEPPEPRMSWRPHCQHCGLREFARDDSVSSL